MKKLTILCMILWLSSDSLFAQILDQGNFMIGAATGFSTGKSRVKSGTREDDGLAATQINFAPSIGYFVADRFVLGLGADFTRSEVTEPNKDKTEDSDLLFGPFTRYYIPVADNVAVFAVANFGFGNSTDNQVVADVQQNIRTNILAVGAGPGLTVYADGGFGLEAIVKYNFAKSNFDTDIAGVKTSNTTRTNQISLSLGLQYYFGGLRRLN